MTMKRNVAKKSLNFKDARQNISVPFSISTNLQKKFIPKNPNELFPGQILGQDRPEKNSAQCLIRSGEIPSPRQTSIDKTNDCAMKSERGELVRGSDPPSGHSVHKTTGNIYVTGAGQTSDINTCLLYTSPSPRD